MDDNLFAYQVDGIQRKNHRSARRINNLAQQLGETDDITQEVKKLLKKLYNGITAWVSILAEYLSDSDSEFDEVIFGAWRSFLQPIKALREIPTCGEFVAARMLLCVAQAFEESESVKLLFHIDTLAEEIAPLCEFITDLDDALLEPLKKIWTSSGSRERFDWAFMDCYSGRFRKTVKVLSPQELKDRGGIKGKKYWYKDPNGSGKFTLYQGPIPRWDCGEQDWDDFEWKDNATDGPIDRYLEYRYHVGDGSNWPVGDGIEMFRRSRQFCRDARQKSEAHIGRQQHQAFHEVARRHLPPEIRHNILSYIKYRDPFPYLEKLDLAEAYVPFPQVGEHCARCDPIEGESTAQRTCPQKAIHVWNLALRRFHTFHETNCHTWSLCARHDCQGHHDDEDWEVEKDPGLTTYLESLAARGNDEIVSLEQVGFGPMSPFRLKAEADGVREYALFRGKDIYKESMYDVRMVGGIGGLKDAMTHGRTLDAVWEGDGGLSIWHDGANAMEPMWQYGRDIYSAKVAVVVMRGLHSEDDCESCVEILNDYSDPLPIAI